jgi:hypothetical protein
LDVYLNGQLDNGPLLGSVTRTQRSSREALYVGRRSDLEGFEFSGVIDDVHLYSRALTQAEVNSVMRAASIRAEQATPTTHEDDDRRHSVESDGRFTACGGQSDREDAALPATAAVLGVLVTAAVLGLWPSGGALLGLCLSPVVGVLLSGTSSTLPSLGQWILPLASLAGSASVIAGLLRPTPARPG